MLNEKNDLPAANRWAFFFLCWQQPKEERRDPNGMPIQERKKLTKHAIRLERNEAESEMRIMFAMCRDGSTVHVFGNTISVSGRGMSETYILCGNMLTGPHGFRLMNCRSVDEAFCMVCGVHGGKSW